MKYIVTSGGRDYVIELHPGQIAIDGDTVSADLIEIAGSPTYVLSSGGHQIALTIRRDGRGRYTVWTDRYRHDVEAVDERTRAIRQLTAAKAASGGPALLLAPMPGLIIRVQVNAGDAVQAGQGLVVMEAMKMENELRAAGAGTVKSVRVIAGAAVEKGAILVELE